MKRLLGLVGLVGLVALLGAPLACGDDDDDDDGSGMLYGDCPAVCSAAQAASCTVVTCDCGQYCNSLTAFMSKGDCGATASAYEDCALSNEACTISSACNSQEDAFGQCVAAYCAAHMTDSDCVFLMGC
jgi:hypothetical protein